MNLTKAINRSGNNTLESILIHNKQSQKNKNKITNGN